MRDEYIACWFRSAAESVTREDLAREDLHLEVGEFGAPAVFVVRNEDGIYHANFRLPPGTPQGWNQVRLRLKDSRFGKALRIAVDMPAAAERITLQGICDGRSWQPGEVQGETAHETIRGAPGHLAVLRRPVRLRWTNSLRAQRPRYPRGSPPGSASFGTSS